MIETKFDIKNIGTIEFDIKTQFHTLKHFISIDNKYKNLLISESLYTEEEILNQFNEVGSKFSEKFAKNPFELIIKLIQHIENKNIHFNWTNNRCEIKCEFNNPDYPDGIGFDCLLAKNELSEIEKSQITQIERSSALVYILNKKPHKTLKFNIILNQTKTNIKIISIFPGIYAPVLPNIEIQNKIQYSESSLFWKNYVFLFDEFKNRD